MMDNVNNCADILIDVIDQKSKQGEQFVLKR